jgi:hypothetical protein
MEGIARDSCSSANGGSISEFVIARGAGVGGVSTHDLLATEVEPTQLSSNRVPYRQGYLHMPLRHTARFLQAARTRFLEDNGLRQEQV